MSTKYYKLTTRKYTEWRPGRDKSKEYDQYVIVAVDDKGHTIAGAYFTTADWEICRGCGAYVEPHYSGTPRGIPHQYYYGPEYGRFDSGWEEVPAPESVLLPIEP